MSEYQVINSDILKWAEEYDGPPFHCLICDPPYHLTSITKRFGKPGSAPARGDVYRRASAGFMNESWDGLGEDGQGIAFKPETWAAMGQRLYPGAFGMAFASSRGWHRMAVAIEDAGFVIHPSIFMLGYSYGSGFPKATRIDTQVDKAAGNDRPDKLNGGHIGMGKHAGDADNENELENRVPHVVGKGNLTNGTPVDPIAKIWQGHRYGLQALKPALEPIIVFQKPYEGRPVDDITTSGAGALNIDAARIGTAADMNPNDFDDSKRTAPKFSGLYNNGKEGQYRSGSGTVPDGRWPANLLLHHNFDCQPGQCSEGCPVERLGEMSGESKSSGGGGIKEFSRSSAWKEGEGSGFKTRLLPDDVGIGDSGTAARYFFQADWHYEILERLQNADPVYYTAKASRTEREAGLDNLPTRTRHRMRPDADPDKLTGLNTEPRFAPTQVKNNHPTVKSLSLCMYLSKLLAPPNAYAPRRLLVPFSGSGSEICGAILTGQWESITGIEQSPEYCKIAEARIKFWESMRAKVQAFGLDAILQAYGRQDTEIPDSQLRLPF